MIDNILNLTGLLTCLYINYKNTDKISNNSRENELTLTPAGFTFSIWGVIYTGLLLSVFANIIKPTTDIDPLIFGIINILNCMWIFAWANEKLRLSSLILISIPIALYQIIKNPNPTFAIIPFAIYFSWTVLASSINLGIVSKRFIVELNKNNKYKYKANEERLPSIIVCTTISLLTLFTLKELHSSPTYTRMLVLLPILGTIVWACIGITSNVYKKRKKAQSLTQT